MRKLILQRLAQRIDSEPKNRTLRDDYLTLKVTDDEKVKNELMIKYSV